MKIRYKAVFLIIAFLALFLSSTIALGQEDAELPVYVVQPGENLTLIAQKFNINVNDLIHANAFLDPNLITAGSELFLPGFEGVSGRLVSRPLQFGETLNVILRETQLSPQNFLKMNNITSPAEMYVGFNIILPVQEENFLNNSRLVAPADSNLSLSARNEINPWTLSLVNGVSPVEILPGEVLYFPSEKYEETASLISDRIAAVEISPLPVVQGRTSIIRTYAKSALELSGSFNDEPLTFFYSEEGGFYYALHGFHAMAEPGLISLNLNGIFEEDGQTFASQHTVLMVSGNYTREELFVDDATIQPEITQSEYQQVQEMLTASVPEKLWHGPFRFPVAGSLEDNTIVFSSPFGARRTYNRGQYEGFHGGLDFSVVLESLNVYASAAGRVLYTGELIIRGKNILIDHGQGVVTGYTHLNEYYVQAGDLVEPGQLIGQIGGTGRVTGPHLHWDVYIHGTQVAPLDWVNNTYP